jgi:hypothetical protein
MDHNTLFPFPEMGFLFLDIHLKPEKCSGCKYWQDSKTTESNKLEANHRNIINSIGVKKFNVSSGFQNPHF